MIQSSLGSQSHVMTDTWMTNIDFYYDITQLYSGHQNRQNSATHISTKSQSSLLNSKLIFSDIPG